MDISIKNERKLFQALKKITILKSVPNVMPELIIKKDSKLVK